MIRVNTVALDFAHAKSRCRPDWYVMQIDNLDDFDPGSEFEADIAIIGAGPAGITIAREFLNSPYRVLLIESGLVDEHEPHMRV